MRKILAILLLCAAPAMARDVYISTAPATEGTRTLCGGASPKQSRGYLYSVCTSSAIAATGITLFNSSFTTTGVQNTGFISTANFGCIPFQTQYTAGLMYVKTGPANVIIDYDCY